MCFETDAFTSSQHLAKMHFKGGLSNQISCHLVCFLDAFTLLRSDSYLMRPKSTKWRSVNGVKGAPPKKYNSIRCSITCSRSNYDGSIGGSQVMLSYSNKFIIGRRSGGWLGRQNIARKTAVLFLFPTQSYPNFNHVVISVTMTTKFP